MRAHILKKFLHQPCHLFSHKYLQSLESKYLKIIIYDKQIDCKPLCKPHPLHPGLPTGRYGLPNGIDGRDVAGLAAQGAHQPVCAHKKLIVNNIPTECINFMFGCYYAVKHANNKERFFGQLELLQ